MEKAAPVSSKTCWILIDSRIVHDTSITQSKKLKKESVFVQMVVEFYNCYTWNT